MFKEFVSQHGHGVQRTHCQGYAGKSTLVRPWNLILKDKLQTPARTDKKTKKKVLSQVLDSLSREVFTHSLQVPLKCQKMRQAENKGNVDLTTQKVKRTPMTTGQDKTCTHFPGNGPTGKRW